MKNWKTTLGGILVAVGLFLTEQTNPVLKLAGQIIAPVGAFLLGSSAKDNNVTGGTVKQ